jgi:hypothetical protein
VPEALKVSTTGADEGLAHVLSPLKKVLELAVPLANLAVPIVPVVIFPASRFGTNPAAIVTFVRFLLLSTTVVPAICNAIFILLYITGVTDVTDVSHSHSHIELGIELFYF